MGRLRITTVPASQREHLAGNTKVEPLVRVLVQPSLMVWNRFRVGFEPESLTGCTNGRGNCPLNWQNDVIMTTAEREGFEPSDPVSQVNSLAVSPIRPLSHLSSRVFAFNEGRFSMFCP